MASTIFFVDDDPILARVLAEELTDQNRRVCSFSDPLRALAALAHVRADLLITDLSMPWIDGRAVVSAARSRQPDLKILLVSGYARGREVADAENVGFLPKPICLEALLSAVDEALGEAPGQARTQQTEAPASQQTEASVS